jgi:hypothetical protein
MLDVLIEVVVFGRDTSKKGCMMLRSLVGATAAATVALGCLAGTAMATPAPPPLSGETLTASETSLTTPYPFLLPCGDNNGQPTGDSFNLSGTATGPYAGSFIESGTALYPSVATPGPVDTSLTEYTATFTIHSPNATVTGNETMTGSALAACEASPGGQALTIGPVSTTYAATIATATGTYADQGTSTATLEQILGSTSGNWGADLTDGSFVSTATRPRQPGPRPCRAWSRQRSHHSWPRPRCCRFR